jgi:uncharacterized protein (DUF2141 family)
MRYISLTILLIALNLVCNAQTSKLTIICKGLNKKKGGLLRTALYSEANFPKDGKESYGKEVRITKDEMQVVYENLPQGNYAVACYQDADENKKLNKNFVGYPSEPFGFSNDAKIKLGPPSFDDAKIEIKNKGNTTITINMKK